MRRTERWWGDIVVSDIHGVSCPLCRTRLVTGPWARRLPAHLTEALVTCDGSHKTLEFARELAALRLRAHP